MPLNPRLADWSHRVVWLIGASTGIGCATAARLYRAGAQVVLSARNVQALDDFGAAHPGTLAMALDVGDAQALKAAAERLHREYGRLDLVMYCAGHYRPMRAELFDLREALVHQRVNYVGALHLLDAVLPILLGQGHGHLSLVASVAGYRGLPQALAYGPTKAALINLAEVLYLDLQPRGIGVSVVNPGFVRTPLTAQNAFHMPALLTPSEAAEAIVQGWARGRFEIHFPRRFTLWLKALRAVHDRLYFAAVRRTTGL